MCFCRLPTLGQKEQFVPLLEEMVKLSFSNIESYFLAPITVDNKSNGTPVTQADKGTERLLRDWIEAHFPEHGVYGEEYGIKPATGAWPRYRWILDPIDGTRAFISHSFHFGTLIALEYAESAEAEFCPILSAVAFPAARLWVIGTGDSATLTRLTAHGAVSQPVHVRDTAKVSDATLLMTSHWSTSEQVGDKRLQRLIDGAKLYRTWGDCFGYFAVATGGADIMIDPDLSYWDVAALLPVVEGAGGILTSLTGGNPLKDLSALCVCSESLYQEVVSRLNDSVVV